MYTLRLITYSKESLKNRYSPLTPRQPNHKRLPSDRITEIENVATIDHRPINDARGLIEPPKKKHDFNNFKEDKVIRLQGGITIFGPIHHDRTSYVGSIR